MRRVLVQASAGLVLVSVMSCGGPSNPQPADVVVEEAAARPSAGDFAATEGPGAKETASAPASGSGLSLPDDAGGKLLGKLLAPTEPGRLPPQAAQGRRERPIPPSIERPTQFSRIAGTPRLTPPAPNHPAVPAPVPERVPAALARVIPELPGRVELPVGGAIRIPSPDASKPAALATLARPVTDRASLEDPTAEFSTRAVTGAAMPLRTSPAPFVKVNLPDPFEHAETVKLRLDLAEDPNKSLGTVPAPKQ